MCLESSQGTVSFYTTDVFQVTLWAHELSIWLCEDVKTKDERGGGHTAFTILSLRIC